MKPQSRAESAASPGRLAATGPGRFTLAGDVGFDDAARLLAAGDAAFGTLTQAEVDLAGVSHFDSAGLALLLEWVVAARAAGRSLNYRNVPPAVASLAGISDVAEMLASPAGG